MKRYAILVAVVAVMLMVQAAPATELVTNGGFETGDFSGWTHVDTSGFDTVVSGSASAHSGSWAAELGPYNVLGSLSQSFTTTPGASYDVSFWLRRDTASFSTNSFAATFDGNPLSVAYLGEQPYTLYHFTQVASGTSAELNFSYQDNSNYFLLDDVSAHAVPIPGAVWLLGSGLVGLAGLRRKFKA